MRVLQGILLSLMIHFFVVWCAQFAPHLDARPKNDRISVEILDPKVSQDETTRTQQIVRQALLPEKLKTENSQDRLTFLSEQTQRVQKQTRAELTGLTQNRSSQKTPETPQQAVNPKDSQPRSRGQNAVLNKGGLEAFAPQYRKSALPQVKEALAQESGLSTIGQAMPVELAVGSFTALNTDRYLFYSFFARIEEMIRFRWETSVQQAIDTTPTEKLASNPSNVWTTNMEVWIKRNGELDSIHIMKESGVKAFDRAAALAFQQARMFPNPPQEMVESDGLIHLKYSFQVRYEPKVLVKSRQ